MLIQNSNSFLYDQRWKTITRWGKYQTGLISYMINTQGFRGKHDYSGAPDFAFFGSSTVFGIGINEEDTLVSHFSNAHNYGLAGDYLNNCSIKNLKNFLNSPVYNPSVKIIFFWIDRPGQEDLNELLSKVQELRTDILHISQGIKYKGMLNLMPHVDLDVSGTQPGIKTHRIWATAIKQLIKYAR